MSCERTEILTLICNYIPQFLMVLIYIAKGLVYTYKGPKLVMCRIISLLEQYFLLLKNMLHESIERNIGANSQITQLYPKPYI
jgi:hypothetical protein